MKRFGMMILIFGVLMCLLVVNASAVETSGECGENAKWKISGGTLTISGTGEMTDYYYLVGLERPGLEMAPWRDDETYTNTKITKIVIKSGITRIGDNAFCCLPNVKSVTIPDTVTSIGQAAFCDIEKLTKITIPESVTHMERSVFSGCIGLTTVKLPSRMEEFEGIMFYECSNLKHVTLPEGITKIEARTFEDCFKLESVSIPEGVKEIEAYAFNCCENLKTVKLPVSLESLGVSAFDNTGLVEITIPPNVREVRNNTLGWCISLKKVYFTGDAPEFDSCAFECTTTTAYYPAENPTWTEEVRKDYEGTITWIECGGQGDLDKNGPVNEDDAIYLLQHVLMPGQFPITQDVDFDGNGRVNEDDAIYLLQHILMPGQFPL